MDWRKLVLLSVCLTIACGEDAEEEEDAAGDDIDRTCYADGSLGDEQTFVYAITDATEEQFLVFEASTLASESELRPLLIWLTGNTWASNNAPTNAPPIARSIAREIGAHYARVSYRHSDATPWPLQIQDVKTAIRYLHTRAAELHIDAERVFIGGDQTGAHLASLSATSTGIDEFLGDDHLAQTDRVEGAILLGGVYDFETITEDILSVELSCDNAGQTIIDATKTLFGCSDAPDEAPALQECDFTLLEQASPLFHASSDDPALLLWHGEEDCEVPSRQSERLAETLVDRSLPVHLDVLVDAADVTDTLSPIDVEIALAEMVECSSE